MRKFVTPMFMVAMLFSLTVFGQNRFDRLATIDAMPEDVGGFGNFVAGVDLDNDGLLEIYTVNDDWFDQVGLDLVPRIYKYEDGPNGWELVWSTRLPLEFQNTWPALAAGDLDNDGKAEIIWTPTNNTGGGLQPNPERIVVFETPGDGSNGMGVDNGDGTWRPNASWTIASVNNANIRPFKIVIADIDSDGVDEVVASCRAGDGIQIYSVDNVPDAADSSDVWTLEFSGVAGTHYDLAVIGNTVYGIQDNGNVTSVSWDGTAYVIGATQAGIAGGGAWNSAQVVDVDGDTNPEIILASWSTASNNVYLMQQSGDTLLSYLIKDVPAEAGRLYGGAAGDIDGDGMLDFGFGTRGSSPNGAIFRLEYQGGDVTDEANWALQMVDAGVSDAQQYDLAGMADLTGDGKDEFLYSGTPRGLGLGTPPQPVVILSEVNMNAPVVDAVVDVPNDQGRQVWVVWQGSADDMGGMRFSADLNGNNQPTPIATTGHGRATFTLSENGDALHYMLESYNIDDVTASHIHVGEPGVNGGVTAFLYSGTPAGPVNGVLSSGVITEADLLGAFAGDFAGFVDALMSGGLYVNVHTSANPGGEIRGQIMTDPLTAAPMAPTGFTIEKYVVWRIDGGSLPVQVAEVQAIQSSHYAAVVPTLGDGEEYVSTYVVSSHTANALVNWKSFPKDGVSEDNLAPSAPGNAMVSATQGTVNLTWEESVDADFDYFSVYRSDNPDALGSLVGNTTGIDFVEENVPNGDWYYQISATDFNGNEGDYTVASIVVGIGDDNNLPNEFSLEQNYPNPFNPSTSIEFALPQTVDVSLKIYNIRGQLVKTLVDGSKSAGRYSLTWDGTDNFGSRVASGTYIYSIKAGEFVNNKKMVLLK